MGHQASKMGLRNDLKDYGLRNLTSIPRKLVELKRQWEWKEQLSHSLQGAFHGSLSSSMAQDKNQEPDTKNIPKDRDIRTVRVKCSSLFQRCCVAGLGQLCHCHLMLLVGNVMGVVLMCVDEGSGPQLALLLLLVCTPRHPGERRGTACGRAHCKGQGQLGVCGAEAFGGGSDWACFMFRSSTAVCWRK